MRAGHFAITISLNSTAVQAMRITLGAFQIYIGSSTAAPLHRKRCGLTPESGHTLAMGANDPFRGINNPKQPFASDQLKDREHK